MATRLAWLRPEDEAALFDFLDQHRPLHSGLLSLLEQGILQHAPMAMVGVWQRQQLLGVLALGASALVSRCEDLEGLALLARCLCAQPDSLVMLGGPAYEVSELRRHMRELELQWGLRPLTLAGPIQSQMLMARRPGAELMRSTQLRPAVASDAEALVEADLAMVQDELGFNPFAFDLALHRRGVVRRISERRTWLMGELGQEVRFKVDITSVSANVVQLAGVYTAPSWRQQGLALEGMGELCSLLLRDVPLVVLQVSTTNTAAMQLYHRLGFERIAATQTAWFIPDGA